MTNTIAPRDEGAEQRAQREAPRDGASERRDDALGQARVVQRLLRRAGRRHEDAFLGDVDRVVTRLRGGAGSGIGGDIRDEMRDALLGGRLGRDRELLIVVAGAVRGRSVCGWHD